jgi:hypothetical protein
VRQRSNICTEPGVYFGARDDAVFASVDSWQLLADDLPGLRPVKVAYTG